MNQIRVSKALVEKLTHEEVIAVILHEVGHHHHKHILIISVFNCFYMLLFGLVLWPFAVGQLRVDFLASFGITYRSDVLTFLFFALLWSRSLDIIIRVFLINQLMQRHEYQADTFAAASGAGGRASDMIHGLLRFSVTNADLLHRSPLNTAMTKSHPSTEDRILKLARDFDIDLG